MIKDEEEKEEAKEEAKEQDKADESDESRTVSEPDEIWNNLVTVCLSSCYEIRWLDETI